MKKNSSVDVCAQYACGNIEGTNTAIVRFTTRKKVTKSEGDNHNSHNLCDIGHDLLDQ